MEAMHLGEKHSVDLTDQSLYGVGPQAWTEKDRLASLSCSDDPGPYLKGDYLGCGGSGRVDKVLRKSDGRVFAGKSSPSFQQLVKEVRVLRRLQHPHIIKLVDWYEDTTSPGRTLLVTELCSGGNLQTLIDHGSCGMNREQILQVVRQTASALEFLHGRSEYHSDVKPRNILIRTLDPTDVALGDVADVKRTTCNRMPIFRSTPLYASPEAVASNRHGGPADDVWALGITLLAMVEQSPKVVCTKEGLKEYPLHCYKHVEELRAMNPTHGLVGLLGMMVVWKAVDRSTAADCGRRAADLLLAEPTVEDTGSGGKFGIRAPDGFQAITFW